MSEREFLDTYDKALYEKPSVTTDVLIFTIGETAITNYRKLPESKLQVLLIKRKEHPFQGAWALPGGFVQIDESVETCAYRELSEETGVRDVYLEQLYTWGDVARDPRMRVITVSYMALAPKHRMSLKPGTDASEAAWFDVTYALTKEERTINENRINHVYYFTLMLKCDLDNQSCGLMNQDKGQINQNKGQIIELNAQIKIHKVIENGTVSVTHVLESQEGVAFDHGKIIAYAVERLRNKIEYTDIIFNMMPQTFTQTALQQAYETILSESLLKANFRRKIGKMLIETDDYYSHQGHRPSKLYRFNPEWSGMI